MTLLRQVVASCEWVLTQCLTSCPEFLPVSVLAIAVQACLDVVSHSFRLSLFNLTLGLRFMCVLLWRLRPTPRALRRVLVPMVFLYFVCYALPGADAMEDSSFSRSSSGGDYARTRELSSLSYPCLLTCGRLLPSTSRIWLSSCN